MFWTEKKSWYAWLKRWRSSASLRGDALRIWFASTAGERLLAQQKHWLSQVMRHCWGDKVLSLSVCSSAFQGVWPKSISEIWHFLPMGLSEALLQDFGKRFFGDLAAWPVVDQAVPLVVLHHSIELSENKHHLLQEAARVLSPGGHLLILGFNPWHFSGSIGALRHPLGIRQRMGLSRLVDWLQLLGFDLDPMPLPLDRSRQVGSSTLSVHQQGAWYGLVARKSSAGMTLDRCNRRSFSRLVPMSPMPGIVAPYGADQKS